jgi:hypothetical protein
MEEPLSLKDELALRLHLFICEFCEQFQRQIKVIRQALNQLTGPAPLDGEENGPAMPEDAKARLKEKLREKR